MIKLGLMEMVYSLLLEYLEALLPEKVSELHVNGASIVMFYRK